MTFGDRIRAARKAKELAPYIEQAFKRKQRMKELADDEIPTVVALGRQITQSPVRQSQIGDDQRKWSETAGVSLEDPSKARKAAR